MLRLTLNTEEYLMIGDDIKIVFLGGTKNNLRIMIDAPKSMGIVRSTVLEKNHPELKECTPRYYAEPELPEKYRKPKGTGRTRGSR
jgi:carbon storage regulator